MPLLTKIMAMLILVMLAGVQASLAGVPATLISTTPVQGSYFMGHDNSVSSDSWYVPYKHYYLKEFKSYLTDIPGPESITGLKMVYSPFSELAGQGYADYEHTFGQLYSSYS